MVKQFFPIPARLDNEFAPERDWSAVVVRIQRGDPTAMEELYRVFLKGIRFALYRQLGSRDLDDKLHDVFVIVAQAIQRGDLREPQRLMGYVRTVLRRQLAGHIQDAVRDRRIHAEFDDRHVLPDRCSSPEQKVIEQERDEIAGRVLKSINKRDREVLIRFYLKGESPAIICRDMGLTETQFRLIKSRAKARYSKLCRSRLTRVPRKAEGRIGVEHDERVPTT
jgi:RNA polymerase sigma-70 factor, ECF subfamily